MVSVGDAAPDFTAPIANGDIDEVTLSEAVEDGPVVLAFFPGAFTPPCSNEMIALQGELARFADANATLLGVSADSPFCQGAFREEHGIEFDLVSDMGGEAIDAYGVGIDIPDLGLHGIANRSVFVIDDEGAVAYRWVAEDPTNEPDYEELLEAVEAA